MSDFLIDDAGAHFAASRRKTYRDSVQQQFAVFINFLQSNELTTRLILDCGNAPDESTKIMKSDLTDEGFQVVQESYDKWLRGIDKGKPISDVSVMEKALTKIRRNRE